MPLKLKTMALTSNVHEIDAMQRWAASLGARLRFDGLLNPRIDGKADARGALQLAPDQVVALDHRPGARRDELLAFCRRYVGPLAMTASRHVFTCGAARTTFTVDPYGRLLPCTLVRRDGYDLLSGTFAAGWSHDLSRVAHRTWANAAPCRGCALAAVCGNCPGAAEMETGDPEALVPLFCEVAHLRARDLLGAVNGHEPDASCCLGARSFTCREIPCERAPRPGS